MSDEEEVEIELCCDGMEQAINDGLLHIVPLEDGTFAEVIADKKGKTGMRVNFCPFCGASRLEEAE